MILCDAGVSASADEESVLLKEIFNLPGLKFKPEVRLSFGFYKSGPLEGLSYLQYEEMPNIAGRFAEQTSDFLNAWVILRKEDNQKFSVWGATIAFWHYDVEKRIKTACMLDFLSGKKVYFAKVVENEQNVWLNTQDTPIKLSLDEINKVWPLAENTLQELLKRFAEKDFVWDFAGDEIDL